MPKDGRTEGRTGMDGTGRPPSQVMSCRRGGWEKGRPRAPDAEGEIARISQIMLTGGVIRDHTEEIPQSGRERYWFEGDGRGRWVGGTRACKRARLRCEIIGAPLTYPEGACRSPFRAGTAAGCSRPPPSGKTRCPSQPAPLSPSRPHPCCSPSAPPGIVPGAGSSIPPPSSAGGTLRPRPRLPPPPGSCPRQKTRSPQLAFLTRTCGNRSAKTS